MEYNISITELTHDDLVSILSGADSGISYWAELMEADDNDYYAAREELINDMGNDISYEDVLATVLKKGKNIVIVDNEEGESYTLNLNKLLTGVGKAIAEHLLSFDIDDWDAADCDVAIQMAIFGEVTFG